MPDQNEIKELIYEYLKTTYPIYDRVKYYSILFEKLHPEQKAPIHGANELKGIMFHFYQAVNEPEHLKANLHEAKEHLCRAFYDLHGMVVGLYITIITNKVQQFKIDTISTVAPEYLQTIKPSLREIQKNLIEIKSKRNTDTVYLNDNLPRFQEQINDLENYLNIIDEETPNFIKYEKDAEEEDTRKKKSDRLWDVVKIFVTFIITAAATYFITIATTKKKIELESSQKLKDENPTLQIASDTPRLIKKA